MRPIPSKSKHLFRNGIRLKTNISHLNEQSFLSFRIVRVSLLAREAILLICLAELDAFRGKTPLLIEMGEAGRCNWSIPK